MTDTVKNTDIPGPTSLEAYELAHKPDLKPDTSKEARLEQLYQDLRSRMDRLLPNLNKPDEPIS